MIKSYLQLHAILTRRETRNFYILVLMMLVEAVLEMIAVALIPAFISIIAFPESIAEYEIFNRLSSRFGHDWTSGEFAITAFSLFLVAFLIVKTAYSALSTYYKTRYTQNRSLRFGKTLYSSYLHAPYVFHLERSNAELLRNITHECILLSSHILMPMTDLISQSLILAGIITILLFSVPLDVLIILIAFLALGIAVASLLNAHAKTLGVIAQRDRKDLLQVCKEGLEGAKEIGLLHRNAFFLSRFNRTSNSLLGIERNIKVMQNTLPNIVELVTIIGLLGVTVYLFQTGQPAELVIPTLSIFAVALARMKGSLRMIMFNLTEIRHFGPSLNLVANEVKAMTSLLSTTSDSKEPSDSVCQLQFNKNIYIGNLHYRYPKASADAVSGIDFTIHKGKMIGLVGFSGSGKSTLIDLITGVLQPTLGEITSDGQSIHQNLRCWQSKIGYIPQDLFLVDGSIKQNIALGIENKDIDPCKLESAIKAANLSNLMARLSDGVDTQIGDRGLRLSGGERQRIVIARALYNNPDILILDEATSSLDNVTEAEIISEIEALRGDRTIIIIAHRLTTVKRCDNIIFLKAGQIDSSGTYDSLAASHPDFSRMINAN